MATTATPISDVELHVISSDSTRAQVLEALAHCNATAKRTPARDKAEIAVHGRIHEYENYLITLLPDAK